MCTEHRSTSLKKVYFIYFYAYLRMTRTVLSTPTRTRVTVTPEAIPTIWSVVKPVSTGIPVLGVVLVVDTSCFGSRAITEYIEKKFPCANRALIATIAESAVTGEPFNTYTRPRVRVLPLEHVYTLVTPSILVESNLEGVQKVFTRAANLYGMQIKRKHRGC